MQRRSRVSLYVLCLAFAALTADAAEPVGITAIDARAGVVTARDATRKLTIQFKVTDAALLKSLRVGQTVQADVGTQRVSVNGAQPCCAILNVQTGAPAQSGATGQAMQNAGGDPLGGGGPPRRIGSGKDYPNCSTCGAACKSCADRNMACDCTQTSTGSNPGPEDDKWSCTCSGPEPRLPGER